MILSTLRLFPPRDQRLNVLGILRSVQGPAQALSRCLSSRLFEEDGYDEAILYMEQWESEQELNRHIRSNLYNRILVAAELSRTPPEFDFHYIRESRKLDMIEALRTPPPEK